MPVRKAKKKKPAKKKAEVTDDALTALREAITDESENITLHDALVAIHAAITDKEIQGAPDPIRPHLANIRTQVKYYIQARG